MKIMTSKDDDFLYDKLLALLYQIKLVQGGTSLSATLRRHSKVKNYLIAKQVSRLEHIEETYFDVDGLDQTAIESYLYEKEKSLQK